MGKIIICGDSFSIGIGCKDLLKDSYGPLLAKHYGRDLLNFAKGSSTNYSIFLQAKYAIENIKDIDLLIISDTCPHRVNFFKGKEQLRRSQDMWTHPPLTNLDVNYHEYPPYGEGTYPQVIPHPYKDNPKYKGTLNTENWHGVVNYCENFERTINRPYFNKFKGDKERLYLLLQYYLEIFDIGIQTTYDEGILFLAYNMAVAKGIPTLVAAEKETLAALIKDSDYVRLSWGELALEYPDDLKSAHTSEEGHKKAFSTVANHIDKYKLLER